MSVLRHEVHQSREVVIKGERAAGDSTWNDTFGAPAVIPDGTGHLLFPVGFH